MTNSRKLAMLALILVVVTVGLYWPTTRQDFAVVDDDDYVTENPWVNEGMSWEATRWAFTTYHAANWHPLTWLSHQADWSMYGPFAGGHHLTNILLHAANTLLLFLLLRSLTGSTGRSWIVAALFGWHPLHVESVAWVAERKDLLSTLCLLGSLWTYGQYAKVQDPKNRQANPDRPTWPAKFYYGLSLAIFVAGLMCKPMIVTLPCLLFLLDYWPLQRFTISFTKPMQRTWIKLLLEKIPFFALSVGGCLLTLTAQHAGGAIKSTGQYSLTLRALNALGGYGEYLAQTIWPDPLCIFYPMPTSYPITAALISLVALAGLTLLAVHFRRPCPWLLSGWLWFLGSLVPVIGLVQVGSQAHADRYTYIPSIGLYWGLIWGIHYLMGRRLAGEKLATGLAAVSLVACVALTYHQLGYWRDSVTLFSHALERTPNNAFSQNNLGVAYAKLGQSKDAIFHYREAIRLEPNTIRARYNLGVELAGEGELDAASQAFSQALQISPHSEMLLNNYGVILAQQGKYEAAIGEFREAMKWNPIYLKSYLNAGVAFQALGQAGPAVTNYSTALHLDPNSLEGLRHFAYLLATCPEDPYHQPQQAIQLAERCALLTGNRVPEYIQTLAIAYGAAGQFTNATAADEKALELAQQNSASNLVSNLQKELTAYRLGINPQRDWKHPQ